MPEANPQRQKEKRVGGQVAERRSYTDQERELGLTAIAIASGNVRRAGTLLEAHGTKIPRSTLDRWKHQDDYAVAQERVRPVLQAKLAEDAEDVVQLAGEMERVLFTDLMEKRGQLEARDIAGALRNVSTVKGINAEKAQLWRGLPTQISHHTDDLSETLKRIERLAPGSVNPQVIESTAIEDKTSGPGWPE